MSDNQTAIESILEDVESLVGVINDGLDSTNETPEEVLSHIQEASEKVEIGLEDEDGRLINEILTIKMVFEGVSMPSNNIDSRESMDLIIASIIEHQKQNEIIISSAKDAEIDDVSIGL